MQEPPECLTARSSPDGFSGLELGEIMNLQLGDIIQLDTKVDQPLVMQVANQKLFKVFIGKVGTQMAVQVSSSIQKENQVIDP